MATESTPTKKTPPRILTHPLKTGALNAYYPVTPGSMPSPLSAIFLAQFNVHTGYELKWSLSNDGVPLKGVEFKALPSGLHAVERDVILFVQPKADTDDVFYGVSVFHQNLTDSRNDDRESVKMFSLGVIVDPSKSRSALSWKPSSYTSGLEYIEQLDSMLSNWSEDDGYKAFEDFFNTHSGNDLLNTIPRTPKSPRLKLGTSSHEHYLLKLEPLLKTMGPLVFTAWRSCLLRERILLFDAESVELSCAFAYCLSVISTIPHEILSQLSDETEPLHYLQPFYSVGINDIDWLAQNATRGFIACSTDEILMFKNKIYDIAIQLGSDPVPKVLPAAASDPRATNVKLMKATQRDLKRFRLLAREFNMVSEEVQEFPSPWWCEVSEPVSWRQLAWSGLYWWASAGEKDKLEDEQNSEGLCDIGDLSTDSAERALYIVGYFQSITRRIFRVLGDILNSTEEDDIATIEFTDMLEMGLDPYSQQDSEFVVKLVKCWWSRDVKAGSSLSNICCSL